jgi:hypothetical protein
LDWITGQFSVRAEDRKEFYKSFSVVNVLIGGNNEVAGEPFALK